MRMMETPRGLRARVWRRRWRMPPSTVPTWWTRRATSAPSGPSSTPRPPPQTPPFPAPLRRHPPPPMAGAGATVMPRATCPTASDSCPRRATSGPWPRSTTWSWWRPAPAARRCGVRSLARGLWRRAPCCRSHLSGACSCIVGGLYLFVSFTPRLFSHHGHVCLRLQGSKR
jgi:hypothetical protein